jgi:antitoxin (DNA-binding transcriptional repressor) of toxin-antitoxin stability system
MTSDVELSKSLMMMHSKDNVAVCLRALEEGEEIQVTHSGKTLSVKVLEAVPLGHKVALSHIASGQAITKYGEIIARATRDIFAGQQVHNHNASDY